MDRLIPWLLPPGRLRTPGWYLQQPAYNEPIIDLGTTLKLSRAYRNSDSHTSHEAYFTFETPFFPPSNVAKPPSEQTISPKQSLENGNPPQSLQKESGIETGDAQKTTPSPFYSFQILDLAVHFLQCLPLK